MENKIKQIKKELNSEQWSLIKEIHKQFIENQDAIDQLKITFKNIMTRIEALEKAFEEEEVKIEGS